MAMSSNSKMVFDYVKQCDAEDKLITANDIAEALGVTSRSVNGIITSAFQRHKEEIDGEKVTVPLMERVPAEVEVDGVHKTVKFIKLTEAGKAFNPEA